MTAVATTTTTIPIVKFEGINSKVARLQQGSEAAAGFDLTAFQDYIIKPQYIITIDSGLRLQIPNGYYGRIGSRSSLALEDIHTMAGVIDCDYRGEIKILLINLLDKDVKIEKGQKYVQIIFEKILTNVAEESLNVTTRNIGGFDSTDNPPLLL